MATLPRYHLQDYTVGWLCAIPAELTAARMMLDNDHGLTYDTPKDDDNSYHHGDINGHKVVIASMIVSSPGLGSAQRLIGPLRRIFRNLRLHLFVGIGGGIPKSPRPENSLRDVHLGDVVIGWPEETGAAAIIQYDFYRSISGGKEHLLLKSFDKPNLQLVSSLNPMISDRHLGNSTFPNHLQKLKNLEKFPNMEEDLFKHPGLENDRLFETKSDHVAPGCGDCKPLVDRAKRVETRPQFHLGTILSGNTLVQNAEERDKLSECYSGALCFEMEAAGVIEDTHCLVIRGISDYADSHRASLDWHNYAAGTAAAFAREILCRIRPETVQKFEKEEYCMSQSPSLCLKNSRRISRLSLKNGKTADIWYHSTAIQDLVDSHYKESKTFHDQFKSSGNLPRSDQFKVLFLALHPLKQARDALVRSRISDDARNAKVLFRLITVENDISRDNDIDLDGRIWHNRQASKYADIALSYEIGRDHTLQLRLEQAFVQAQKVKLEEQRPNDMVAIKRDRRRAWENLKARHTDLKNENPEKGYQYDERVAYWEGLLLGD